VIRRLAVKVCFELRSDDTGTTKNRIISRPGDVRRQHDSVEIEQRMAIRDRLFIEYVKRCTGDISLGDGSDKIISIDESTTSGVHEIPVLVHLFELIVTNHTLRVLREANVKRNSIGFGE
jgi:hypothetical protein